MDQPPVHSAELMVEDLRVAPGGRLVLDRLSLHIPRGQSLAILGRSGCGKTTLLRAIAGLEPIASGSVRIDHTDLTHAPPHRRGLSMVFQNQTPYPHLSVRENLAFSARHRGITGMELERLVDETARALRIEHLLDQHPATLSGGERQRLVLGRAVACRPRVLLLDEPFSNLDAPLRQDLRRDLAGWRHQHRTTLLLVTHDQADAASLAHEIAVMDHGRIIQTGTTEQLYEQPATRLVGQLIGDPPLQFLPGRLEPEDGRLCFQLSGTPSRFPVAPASFSSPPQEAVEVQVGFRPHEVSISTLAAHSSNPARAIWSLPARMVDAWTMGEQTRVLYLVHDRYPVTVVCPRQLALRPGSEQATEEAPRPHLILDPARLHWFHARGDQRMD